MLERTPRRIAADVLVKRAQGGERNEHHHAAAKSRHAVTTLTTTVAALVATLLALLGGASAAFGATAGRGVDYEDFKANVCEGYGEKEKTGELPPVINGCPNWGSHVTGEGNASLGGFSEKSPNYNLESLTSGNFNVAIATLAAANDTTGSSNVATGYKALFANTEGSENVASGTEALTENTASDNVATGDFALAANTTGEANTAVGGQALVHNSTASKNVASGFDALAENGTGSGNDAYGANALQNNTAGEFNVALGNSAGFNVTGSNNIDISNVGAEGESGTTRIGTEAAQTRAFIAGVFPTAVVGCTVQVTSEGQLGCNSSAGGEGKEGKEGKPGAPGAEGKEGKQGPPGTTGAPGKEGPPGKEGKEGPVGKEGKEGKIGPQGPAGNASIATFASFEGVASGRCLNYAEVGDPGTGSCPSKTSGFASSRLLAGPTPANGATVTNLYADSNASVSGTDSVLVAVIDNTTGATLLSCTVTKATKSVCSNPGSSGAVSPGDNLEVKVTATGSSGSEKQWRVRFRY
jgi:Collagen triple helix repeat (20 copies)